MRHRLLTSGLLAAASTALALFSVAAPVAAASNTARPGHVHSMGKFVSNQARPGGAGHTNNLTYHGGPIQQATTVYISYWGSAWVTGFGGTYTSSQAQTYVQDFFGSVGGSSWIGTDTQYCSGVASGTVNCGTAGTHITNPSAQLKGEWNDTSAVPANRNIQDSDVAAAAVRAMQHFGYHADATYLVFTPSGDSESGFAANGGGWCAWHGDTSSSSGTLNYGYIPYMPDAGSSCGMNFINSNNSYGNGYFDGFSIVAGHEYEEAQTDPHLNAWYDSRGSENADKCAWNSLSGNISLGSHVYAVQPVWDNLNSGCKPV